MDQRIGRTSPPLDQGALYEPDPSDHDLPLTTELAASLPDRRTPLSPFMRRWALRIIPLILVITAAIILWRELNEISPGQVLSAMRAWGYDSLAAAIGFSALSFLLMGGVEWLGVRWAGGRVPLRSVIGGAFLSNAIAHSLGANLLVAGAIRAKLYDRYGLGLKQVAAVTLFNGMAFAVGLSTLAGVCMLAAPPHEVALTRAPLSVARGLGVALVTFPAIYIILCAVRRRPLHAFGRSLKLPSVRSALGQLAIGVCDNATAAAILWVLLPDDMVGYATFVGPYAVATVIGLASTVPGGAGVFESTLLTLLHSRDTAAMAAAFLGYRLTYFILPLVIASTALMIHSIVRAHRR